MLNRRENPNFVRIPNLIFAWEMSVHLYENNMKTIIHIYKEYKVLCTWITMKHFPMMVN